jgi:dolichol-phosphate mannosyltransferase
MADSARFLTALPVFNEAAHVTPVLDEVVRYASDVLVVDDGSTDGTSELLARRHGVHVIRHPRNLGYGAALRTAFDYAILRCYDVVVTIDCDGQHEPQRIERLVEGCEEAEIVSGSRYLDMSASSGSVPAERRKINREITAELNRRLGLSLTDAFCGFKAYRVCSLARLTLTEDGYGMPLELWVQAAHHKLKILEVPVPLIYLEEKRSFGGQLDDGQSRRLYYREVLERALAATSPPAPHTWLADSCAVSCEKW